jgi:hypothetical protein
VETLANVAADSIYKIVEGEGIRDAKPLPPAGTDASNGTR